MHAYALVAGAADGLKKKLMRALVLRPLFFLPAERRIAIERRLRGREQYEKLRRADLVVVSFGKSGRTWLRTMLSRIYQLKHGLSERYLIGFDNLHRIDRAIPKIFFTHDNYVKDYTGNADSKVDFHGRKVVLLVRHPADVAVSQYQQWRHRMRPNKKALNAYPDAGDDIDLFGFVARHPAGLGKVVDFMNLWARELPRMGDDLLVVRYEDLRADPRAELARILAFAGTSATAEEVEEAVRFASFDNMKAMEQRGTFWLSGGRLVPRDRKNPESFKVRRAKVGGYRGDFTPEQVAEIDAAIAARLDPAYGYVVEPARRVASA